MAKDFSRAFYKSREWQAARAAFISYKGGLCEDCLAKGIITPGVIVHHIEELTPLNIERPEIRTGFDNLRLVCIKCHNSKEHGKGKGRRYLIGDNGEVIIRDGGI